MRWTGLRLVGRGLSDTLENLLPYTLVSLAWWGCALLVVPAPGALLALFRHADPRAGIARERLGWRESVQYGRSMLGRGWVLVAVTVPLLAVLVSNLVRYGLAGEQLGLLAPLWFLLLLVGLAILLSACSLVTLHEVPVRASLRLAVMLTLGRLPTVLAFSALLYAIVVIGTLLVVPMIMFLPMTIAATFNRFVLGSLGIAIVDPLQPTDERQRERGPRPEHQDR